MNALAELLLVPGRVALGVSHKARYSRLSLLFANLVSPLPSAARAGLRPLLNCGPMLPALAIPWQGRYYTLERIAAWLPARRPENIQSAIDRPLTLGV